MTEQLDFYRQQAEQKQSSIPWLARLQKNALADFERMGFPTRHHEAWKYTSVDSFLKQSFKTGQAEISSTVLSKGVPAELAIGLMDGLITGLEDVVKHLPAGMIVMPLAEALLVHEEKVKPHLARILPHEHAFQALNTAMMQSGLFIYLPEGVTLDKPLLLAHRQNNSNQAVYIRHLVVAKANSRVSLIEDFQGEEAISYFTNAMTEVYAAENAAVHHYKIQQESRQAYHISHLAVNQAARSQVDSHSFSTGGKLVRSDVTMYLNEPHARCFLNGIYAPAKDQHIDHHTLIEHKVPDCCSEQDYKGILFDHSRAVFNGIVKVAKDAQRTVAKQQNKNILLGAHAEVDTKPQLEIFADDVVCTHGATVGQLDEDALFYLATRGIERSEATRYLIQAFAVDNLRAVSAPELSEWMSRRLNQSIG